MLIFLNKLHEQEDKLKSELSKTFLAYLDSLPPSKRLKQMESLLYDIHRNLPTLDRRLTPQEKKCLYLAGKGKEIKEMARIMGLSQRTIKYHRANIVKKLNVPNLIAAVGLGAQLQYVQSEAPIFQLKQVLMSIPGNVFWKDKEGYYLGCNVQQLQVAGKKSLDEILGKTDKDLYPKEIAYRVMQTDKEIIKNQKEKTLEEIGVDSVGAETLYLTKKSPLLNEFGQVIGLIGIGMEIYQ